MRKSTSLFATMLAVSLSTDVWAWRHVEITEPVTSQSLNFPLNENQQWYLRESYLIWKPFEDDLDYADRVSEDIISTGSSFSQTDTSSVFKDRLKHPDFEWSSGVRLALGKYLPFHDRWDLNFVGTYYYSDADSHTKISSSPLERIHPLWNAVLFSIPLKSSAHWKLNYFTTDVHIGRIFSLTPYLQIHPFIGARAAFIFQDYKVHYQSTASLSNIRLLDLSFKGDHDFWAAGPRIGTDLAYHFGRGWSFLASLSSAFFYGRYSIDEKMTGITPTPTVRPFHLRVRDADTLLRTNLEGSIGLEWEKWVRHHTVRIAPSFQVEASEWFGLKRWVETHLPTAAIPSTTELNFQSRRRYSDLGLFGFNINLHIDF